MAPPLTLLKHVLGRGVFPARYAWFLEGRWRRLVLSPERLRQRLELFPEMTALEIGAGSGNYARPLSSAVGRFFALDLQREMLQRLRRKGGASRLFAVQGDAMRLPFGDGSVDLVLAVTVLGETPSARSTIAEAGRVLRPGGVLSVSEHWPDPDFISFDQVDALCREHDFRLKKRYGRRFNYTANFISQSR